MSCVSDSAAMCRSLSEPNFDRADDRGSRCAVSSARDRLARWLEQPSRPPGEVLDEILGHVSPPGGSLGWLPSYDPDEGIREQASKVVFRAARGPMVPRRIRFDGSGGG